jgi:hypothetical protein
LSGKDARGLLVNVGIFERRGGIVDASEPEGFWFRGWQAVNN